MSEGHPRTLVHEKLHQLGSLVQVKSSSGSAVRDVYDMDPKPLGEGRYSRVYGVTHRRNGARRAMKTAKKESHSQFVSLGAECPGRLAHHEANILRHLDHPNIVRIFEAYEEDDAVHLVLELCDGGDVLERILNTNKRMPEAENAALFTQMLFALWHVHTQGMVHRDLKPEHFMFTKREPDRDPLPPHVAAMKLIDFGLSHWKGTSFAPEGGTPLFMPHEVKVGRPSTEYADRADMWALGVTLHTMLVGHYPSKNLTDAAQAQYFAKPAWSGISRVAIDLLGQLLRQGPADRPTAAAALQHPWCADSISGRCAPPEQLLRKVSQSARAYAMMSDFRKIALMAVAREADASEVCTVRRLLQTLTVKCNGTLTLEALREAKCEGALGEAVHALSRDYGEFDVGHQGAIAWTTLLASVLEPPGRQPDAAGHFEGAEHGGNTIPRIHEAPCWRAFDFLSNGTDAVSADSLGQLLATTENGDPLFSETHEYEHAAGKEEPRLRQDPDGNPVVVKPSGGDTADELKKLVSSVIRKGKVDRQEFVYLLRGELRLKNQKTRAAAARGTSFSRRLLRLLQCGRNSGSAHHSMSGDFV